VVFLTLVKCGLKLGLSRFKLLLEIFPFCGDDEASIIDFLVCRCELSFRLFCAGNQLQVLLKLLGDVGDLLLKISPFLVGLCLLASSDARMFVIPGISFCLVLLNNVGHLFATRIDLVLEHMHISPNFLVVLRAIFRESFVRILKLSCPELQLGL
jgi:hypothetical protein